MEFDAVASVQLPLNERVLDRLADILFATDEILDIIGTHRHRSSDTAVDVERSVRHVYNEVNDLMKKLTD